MSGYSLEKNIKSAFISISLLKEIERYIQEQGENQRTEKSVFDYSVTIYDKFGEERIGSFKEYSRSTLPNETKVVTISLQDYMSGFVIKVSFGKSDLNSKLSISIKGNSAKEKALVIANTIETYVNEHKNLNFIFYSPYDIIMMILFGISLGPTISLLTKKGISTFSLSCILISVVILMYFYLKLLNPYSVLETNKNRENEATVNWILNALAGVFIFGLLAAFIRKYIFGF